MLDPKAVTSRKKNAGHVQCPEPIKVCKHLIQEIRSKVPDWENKPDTKMADILTRAMHTYELQLPPSRKTMNTTVTLSIPGGRNKVVIPLLVEPIEDPTKNGVQLVLDHRKIIQII